MDGPTFRFHLYASIWHTWMCYQEQWEFELPADGGPGRMRTGVSPDWREWHPLDASSTEVLRVHCEAAWDNPSLGEKRPTVAIDCSSMEILLKGPDGVTLRDRFPLTFRHWAEPIAPLLQLATLVETTKWPDQAPVVDGRPQLCEVVPEPTKIRPLDGGEGG